MKAIVKNKNIQLAQEVKVADNFMDRLVGLMFKESMEGFDALLIKDSRPLSIHTCFMRYQMDLIILSNKNKIIKIIRNMKPWRFTRIYFSASKALELKGGAIANEIQIGDEVEFLNV